MKKSLLALVALALSGCVTQHATLVNAQGKTMVCDNWGFGFVGAPVAMAQHADCMKKAKAAGYSEGQPAAPSP